MAQPNFFFATTIIFSMMFLISYFAFDNVICPIASQNSFWNIFLVSFHHADVSHVVFNVLKFSLVSLLLERQFGSFRYFLMLLCIIPLANMADFAGSSYRGFSGWTGCGESCVHYFLMGLWPVVVAFNFKYYFTSWKRATFTTLPYAFLLFSSSMGPTINSPSDFLANPSITPLYSLYSNSAHLYPFIAGVIIGLLVYSFCEYAKLKAQQPNTKS